MALEADDLVREFVAGGYQSPAGDLFQTSLLRQWKSQHGVLPGEREEDPYPASETPHGDEHASGRARKPKDKDKGKPKGTPGPQPETSEEARKPVPPGEAREKQEVLPLPEDLPRDRDQIIPSVVYNAPDSRPNPRERSKTDVPIRTVGVPGEQWGNPTKFDYGMPTRRVAAFPKKRQREQRQKAERVSKKWYRKNRSRHTRRAIRRYRSNRFKAQFKRTNRLRHKFPTRFKRRPGGVRDPAQRSREWREEKQVQKRREQGRQATDDQFWVLWGPDFRDALITNLNAETNEIEFVLYPSSPMDEPGTVYPEVAPEHHSVPAPEFYAWANFWEEGEAEELADAIDEQLGDEAWDATPEDIEGPWDDLEGLDLTAGSLWNTHHYEELAPDKLPYTTDQWDDLQDERDYARDRADDKEGGTPRGQPTTKTYPKAPDHWPPLMTRQPYRNDRPDDQTPATPMNDIKPVEQNPGSAKVIPWDADMAQNMDFAIKTADTISMILRRVAPKVKERAKERPARITGVDKQRNLWFFQSGKYFQRLRAIPRSGSKAENILKMDVLVSCSCPFWRWQGPEHWSKENDYLYNRNRTRGTAAYPEIRDPRMRHAVCKHLVSVFDLVKTQKLKISPSEGKQAARYLLDSSGTGEAQGLTPDELVLSFLGKTI